MQTSMQLMFVFGQKFKSNLNNNNNNTKINHKNPCQSRELNTGPLVCQSRVLPLVMGQNINKQSQICEPHLFNKVFFFCNILIRTDNYIWQYHIVTGVEFTA